MSESKSLTIEEAKSKIEKYCAYQDRCHKEVKQKLRDMGVYTNEIEIIISGLIEDNYLNETRFSQSYARGKFRIKRWGKIRINSALKMRNISPWNIKEAMKEISDEDYQTTCNYLVEKYWNANASKSEIIRKKKVWEALQYRGWESEMIYETLAQLEKSK